MIIWHVTARLRYEPCRRIPASCILYRQRISQEFPKLAIQGLVTMPVSRRWPLQIGEVRVFTELPHGFIVSLLQEGQSM